MRPIYVDYDSSAFCNTEAVAKCNNKAVIVDGHRLELKPIMEKNTKPTYSNNVYMLYTQRYP